MDSDDEYEYDTGEDYTYEDDEDNQDALSSDDNDLKSDSMLVDTSSNKIGSSTSPPLSNSEPNSDSKRKSSGKVIPKLKIPDGSYFISEYSSILQIMDGLITEVAALLDLNVDASQILLYHMKWNKERLTDAFFSSSEKLLDDCGLDISLKPVINSIASSGTAAIGTATPTRRVGGPMMPSQGASIDSGNDTFCCRICCDTCPVYDAFSLSCNHAFCVPCYTEYLRMQVNEGPACVQAHCAQHKCRQAITRSVFERFLGTAYPESLEKYKVHVLRNFIEMTKGLQYCPAPGCDKVAVGLGVCTVRCNCGCVFCCKCGEEAHEPCICSQLTDWMTKCSNESETANWILANTKKCPKCNARIEKNQGCNHMNCKLCKFEFCWICMGPWVDHGQGTGGYYKCNRYETSADSSATAAQRAKHELDRYLHYYQRYHGHDQVCKYSYSH